MNDFLWVEKYRPEKVDDCILPDESKAMFKGFLEQGEIPNLLLSGPAGIGKTTIAKALCRELGADFYVINGSDEGRFLDTVRNKAKTFASTVSLTSGSSHKIIIVDEADNTTPDVQLLLRASIEEFQKNCRFIFTCNYKNKIIEPLHSRCSVVDFHIKGKEKAQLASAFLKRINSILEQEGIEFELKVVAEVIQKHFPDFRRTLNELQRYASRGKIDTGILAQVADVKISDLIGYLKGREFTNMKKWVSSNIDNEPQVIMRKIYDNLYTYLLPKSIPEAVLVIGEYQYKATFVMDQEINLVAFLTELMMRCEFK
ncbi:sliding clamp loader [Cyanophage P-RSM6]|uniref:clamp loader of DNA polymerase n=1 Tax=Cyanophage P-RSM6 TaxID=929832 RepID=UPI0002C1841A|nr:clamp loader of DNA polymerase [Cyanophage P-RSM6]AGH56872.1 sliding clamp loader [Cyanophage P-RSM6]|tara:strand:- start:2997 stop:3938 length:942 start_codon:yes stop_codon:yes gene_type:complete